MNAERFLEQLNGFDRELDNKRSELERWRSIATRVTTMLGNERVQTSGSQQKMADATCMMIEVEGEIKRYIEKMAQTWLDVTGVINQLEQEERDLLHKVYVQGYTVETAAKMCGKKKTWGYNTRQSGIDNVQRILKERENGKML